MLHGNPIDAVGSFPPPGKVLSRRSILSNARIVSVNSKMLSGRGKPVCSAIHNFCKQRDVFSSSSREYAMPCPKRLSSWINSTFPVIDLLLRGEECVLLA